MKYEALIQFALVVIAGSIVVSVIAPSLVSSMPVA